MKSRDLIFLFALTILSTCSTLGASVLLANESTNELAAAQSVEKPNILWLTAEDIGPQLACYGDTTVKTPRLDALAKQGMVYDFAWSNYPVCAPARTTIITGMYAASNGAGNMRSVARLPANIKMFPQYLRESGYYCTNKSKEDYNHPKPDGVWDQSNRKADWRKRQADQPFFAVINHTGTHESKIRKRPHQPITDPASVRLTPYWPDIPEVRQDWAQYYDNFVRMDQWIGQELDKLEKAGQSENTIVVFYGDHGSGMPRHKRYAGDSGMRVPFVVHVPEKLRSKYAPDDYEPGGRSNRKIGFVDLAPSMLSIADIAAPEYMQGSAFLGPLQNKGDTLDSEFLFGFRDRMDEKPDFSRSVRDERYLYVRNFLPHLPAGQWLEYQQQTPASRRWFEMFQQEKLNEVQSEFWKPRSGEELYDLKSDPHETKNLRDSPEHQRILARFREALLSHTLEIRDLGFVHEGRLQEITAKGKRTRREFAVSDDYPLLFVFEAANAVGRDETVLDGFFMNPKKFTRATTHQDPTVRYWGTIGLMNIGPAAIQQQSELLKKLLNDPAPEVAMAAAETWIRASESSTEDAESQPAVDPETIGSAKKVIVKYCDMTNSNHYYALSALNIVARHKNTFKDQMKEISAVPTNAPRIKRGGDYVKRTVMELKNRK